MQARDDLVATAAYQPEPAAAAAARRFVRDTLRTWQVAGRSAGQDELVDDAVLLTSELVTNAVVHAGTPVQVTCRLAAGAVEVVVLDRHPVQLIPDRQPSEITEAERTSGRGLMLPSELATSWGVTYARTAKAVWFRLGIAGADAPGEAGGPSGPPGPSGPDGFVAWVATSGFDPGVRLGAIEVVDLCAATDEAYRGLWAYLTSIDLVSEIVLAGRPVDEPVRWLMSDGRVLEQIHAGDAVWLRLLDVPAALSARRYAVADRLTIEIVDDDHGGFAAGRYVLDGGPDGAACRAAPRSRVDLRLHQRALASAYLGGFTLRAKVAAGLVEECTPGALRRADAMFVTPIAPWCATEF